MMLYGLLVGAIIALFFLYCLEKHNRKRYSKLVDYTLSELKDFEQLYIWHERIIEYLMKERAGELTADSKIMYKRYFDNELVHRMLSFQLRHQLRPIREAFIKLAIEISEGSK